MIKRNWMVRLIGSLGLFAVVATFAYTLTATPVAAARPEPDCGPTFSWDCTMPNGSHQYVEGTRCEIAAFQRQTGARCVIA